MISSHSFLLDHFEGPLELLLCLIQKEEIDICTVPIQQITAQLLRVLAACSEVEENSELLGLTATLLLIKSQRLLPQDNREEVPLDTDPHFELIQSLIEYSRFKETAQLLALREAEQKAFFPRAAPPFRKEIGSGLETLHLEELKKIFSSLLERSAPLPEHIIREEEWQVSKKIEALSEALKQQNKIAFLELFPKNLHRKELIVLFLALLEMMKLQQLKVVSEKETTYIISYDRGI